MFVVIFINVCCIFTSIDDMLSKKAKGISEWALENGRQNTSHENPDKSLKRRTVRDQATLIKGFLNDAVVQGIIDTNPADKVEVPRVREDNVKTKSSHRYLPLLESVKADLLDLMESQEELGIYSENGYVYTWEDGRAQRHKRDGEHLQPCKQEVAEQTWCDGG